MSDSKSGKLFRSIGRFLVRDSDEFTQLAHHLFWKIDPVYCTTDAVEAMYDELCNRHRLLLNDPKNQHDSYLMVMDEGDERINTVVEVFYDKGQ